MPPPLPLPRLRICPHAVKMCLPSIGSVAAIPMTPHPPSASRLSVSGRTGSDARDLRRSSALASIGRERLVEVHQQVVAAAELLDGLEVQAPEDLRDLV